MRSALLASLLLCGCDELVATESYGQPFEEVRTRTGYEPGYCFTCVPGFDGKMNCGLKFSYACSCEYTARVEIQPQRERYESGKIVERQSVRELEKLTECE